MTYAEKLKDPRWQKKRLEILERDDFSCRSCGSDAKELHVHHLIYLKGKEPWEYKNEHLVTLCKKCHENENEFSKISQDKLIQMFVEKGFIGDSFWTLRLALKDLNIEDFKKMILIIKSLDPRDFDMILSLIDKFETYKNCKNPF